MSAMNTSPKEPQGESLKGEQLMRLVEALAGSEEDRRRVLRVLQADPEVAREVRALAKWHRMLQELLPLSGKDPAALYEELESDIMRELAQETESVCTDEHITPSDVKRKPQPHLLRLFLNDNVRWAMAACCVSLLLVWGYSVMLRPVGWRIEMVGLKEYRGFALPDAQAEIDEFVRALRRKVDAKLSHGPDWWHTLQRRLGLLRRWHIHMVLEAGRGGRIRAVISAHDRRTGRVASVSQIDISTSDPDLVAERLLVDLLRSMPRKMGKKESVPATNNGEWRTQP